MLKEVVENKSHESCPCCCCCWHCKRFKVFVRCGKETKTHTHSITFIFPLLFHFKFGPAWLPPRRFLMESVLKCPANLYVLIGSCQRHPGFYDCCKWKIFTKTCNVCHKHHFFNIRHLGFMFGSFSQVSMHSFTMRIIFIPRCQPVTSVMKFRPGQTWTRSQLESGPADW